MKNALLIKVVLIVATCAVVGYIARPKFNTKNTPRAHRDRLIVGTNSDYQPYSFIKNGELTGFDIDLIKEIAKRMGKKINFQDMPFTTLIPALQLGKVEVVAAGMSPTPERAQEVLFSSPYIIGDPLIAISLAKNGTLQNLEGLRGKNVVVNEGFIADLYMSKMDGVHLTKLATPTDAFFALKSGRVDFFVAAQKAVQPYFESQGREQFCIFTLPEASESVALAISKKYPELKEKIENILTELAQDGTLEHLKKSWKLS